MLDDITLQKILETSEEQKKFCNVILAEAVSNGFVSPADYFDELVSDDQKQILTEFHAHGLDLYAGFIYFKNPEGEPTDNHSIKLHIPLNNYMEDGILISNLITKKINNITGLKLTVPIDYDRTRMTLDVVRLTKQVPITIYLPKPVNTTTDTLLNNIEEIAFIIHQIDNLIDELRHRNFRIGLYHKIANTDQKIGKYISLTIDHDLDQNYISSYDRYIEDSIRQGVYNLVERGGISGAKVRQALIKNSDEVQQLKKILPYADIFSQIHNYINDYEVNEEDYFASEDETKRDDLFFTPQSDLSPGKLLLQGMRNLILTDDANLDINDELENIINNRVISNNRNLLVIVENFQQKYRALNTALLRHGI